MIEEILTNESITQINENTWEIDDEVRVFVLTGSEKALVIDAGFDIGNLRELVESITDLPYELINTHSDIDHVYGNKEFDRFYMKEEDVPHYKEIFPDRTAEIIDVEDGQIIDLGGRPLEIITTPGHTLGCISILDINGRILFGGDNVQIGGIYLFGDYRNPDEYPASLMKLDAMSDRFDVIFSSHRQLELPPEYIGDIFDAYEEVLHGEVEGQYATVHGSPITSYDCGVCEFLCDVNY